MNTKDIYVLGIETSCDETAAAVMKNGRTLLSNVIFSQVELHKEYGGVVPELASRNHIETISICVDKAIKEAGVEKEALDCVAVTNGPGLVGALLVGVSYAKSFAFGLNKPLVAVHHISGHISANYIESDFEPPFVALVVSGGHTHLYYVKSYNDYELLGKTRDDAAGEAFDKVARVLGLGYPGGQQIDAAAKKGDPMAITFPKALMDNSLDFSFSGLKSAVLNYLNKCKMTGQDIVVENVAASFQRAVVEVLTEKALQAAKEKGAKKIALAGGVASNSQLRAAMAEGCKLNGLDLNLPKPIFCTDNAAMIATRGYYDFLSGRFAGLELNAVPSGLAME